MVTQYYLNVACLSVSRLVVTAVTQYLKVVLFAVPRRLQLLFGITQYLEPSSRNGNPVLSQRQCLGVSRLVVTAVTQYLKVVLFAVPRRLKLLFGITQYLEPSSRNGNPVLSQRQCLGVSRLVVTAVTQYLKVVLFAVPRRLQLLFGITQYLEPSSRNAVTQYLKVVLFAVPRRLQLLFGITQYLEPSSRNGNPVLSQRRVSQCLKAGCYSSNSVSQVVLFAVPRRLQLLFGITQYLEPSSRNGNPVLSQRPCLSVSRLVVTAVTQYLKVVLFAVPRRLQLLFGITQYLEPSSRNGNPVLSQRRVSQCLKAGCYSSNSVSQGRIVRRTSASPAALRDNPVSRAQFSQW
ncbi:hypothetical protein J6590_052001 [Homalodisca vitripennis]|nr:hypothetical protein J6590_052001 [Homalodisca vitripennis]